MQSFLDWLGLLSEAAPPPPPPPPGGGMGGAPPGGGLPPPPPMGGGGMGMGGGMGGMGGGLGGPPGGGAPGGGQQPVPVKTIDAYDVWDVLDHVAKHMDKYDDLNIMTGKQPRLSYKKPDEKISLMS